MKTAARWIATTAATPTASVLAVVAIALVWAALALGQLNGLLASMHTAGSPSFTVADVNHLWPLPDTGSTSDVIQVWKAFAVASGSDEPDAVTASPVDVLRLLALLDSALLVPLYVLLGLLFFRWAFLRNPHTERVAIAGSVLVVLTGVFDLFENRQVSKVVTHAWDLNLKVSAKPIDRDVLFLWIGATGKWALAALTLLCALVVALILVFAYYAKEERPRLWKRTEHARRLVGFQVGAVAVAVVLLNQQGQLADLYRRWDGIQLVASLLFLGFAAVLVWAVTRRLLLWGPHGRLDKGKEDDLKLALGIAVVVLGPAQFGLDRLWKDGLGWGLLVPTGIVAVLTVLGFLLPKDGDARTQAESEEAGAEKAKAENAKAENAKAEEAGAEEQEEGKENDAPKSPPQLEPVLPRVLGTALVLGFAIALLRGSFGYTIYSKEWDWDSAALLVLAAAVGAAASVSLGRRWKPTKPNKQGKGASRLYHRALVEPVGGAAVTTTAVAAVLTRGNEVDPTVLVVLSLLMVVAGLRWFVALRREGEYTSHARLPRVPIYVLVAVVALVWVGIVAAPIPAGRLLGAPGLACLFLAFAVLGAGFLTWVAPMIPQPRALRVFSREHFPILTTLVVWFLLASYFDHDGAYHNAGLDEEATHSALSLNTDEAWTCWLRRQGLADDERSPVEGTGCDVATARTSDVVPLVLVASTGGGIRSAYWTALAVDCAFEVDYQLTQEELSEGTGRRNPCTESDRRADFVRSDALFATSGISGGSLGLAEYAAYLVSKEKPPATDKQEKDATSSWVERALEVDGLSPAGAWWLFAEIPRAFSQSIPPFDRAGVMEQAWEEKWDDGELETGLNELARDHRHAPFLILNSTSVQDGCRFNVSVLDAGISLRDRKPQACRSNAPYDEPAGSATPLTPNERVRPSSTLPASRDLTDLLCDDTVDLNLSTAALLSARFPFVNPTGRVESHCKNESPKAVVHGVDGGYLDTSGASPLVELMTQLQPKLDTWNRAHAGERRCIVPFLIQIDNGFEDTSPPRDGRRPPELTAPLQTLFAARIGRAAEARTGAALLFNRRYPAARFGGRTVGDRYAHFVNEAHPGPAAPFGWAQSRFSQKELTNQLTQRKNLAALAEIDAWFDAIDGGQLACTKPAKPASAN